MEALLDVRSAVQPDEWRKRPVEVLVVTEACPATARLPQFDAPIGAEEPIRQPLVIPAQPRL